MHNDDTEAFHAGEQALQARAGLRERMQQLGGKVMRDYMPDQHRELFTKLPLFFIGSLDAEGQPWASLISGPPGFVASPDPYTLQFQGPLHAADPLRARLQVGSAVGLLGLELTTRRRNRMNGIVTNVSAEVFQVRVVQSFGNCPKYIHVRSPRFVGGTTLVSWDRVRPEGAVLSLEARQLIQRADTFFIASSSSATLQDMKQNEGVDVSHRGGPAGFVKVQDAAHATLLLAPDYLGNFFFNTLGNLTVYPRAGLLFPDFSTGALLSLAVDAEIVWDEALVQSFPQAQRLLRLTVREGVLVEGALPFVFEP